MGSSKKSSDSKSRKIRQKSANDKKPGKKSSAESNTKKQQKSEKSKSKESLDTKTIRILGNRSVYVVSAEDFSRVSQLIKQQHTAGNLMSTADLHRFTDQSLIAFVNFVQTRRIKLALTYYAITELVTLAVSFQMKELKLALEDCIIEAAKSSEADLLQTLIISDVAPLNPEAEKVLIALATEQIEKLVALPDFHKLPFHKLFQVLSSCELPVTHEIFVADVGLLWLVGQDHVNSLAPSLLSCIRTKFLGPVDRTLILERIAQLNLPSKVVRLARNVFESTNNQRICLDPVHLKKNLPRCGTNANPAHFNPHSSLPLSRPSFSMQLKKTNEKNKKRRPTFDPSTAPKVMDLISQGPRPSKSENSLKSSIRKKISKKKETVSKSSGKKKKSRCACIDYLKNKMGKGKSKKENASSRIRPPGASSRSSNDSSIISKRSSSTRTDVNSNRSDKRLEARRSRKRDKIHNAIKSSKSDTENSVTTKSMSMESVSKSKSKNTS